MVDRLNSLMVVAYARIANRDLRREEGQALTEYALVLGVIVIAIVTALGALSTGIHGKITAVCNAVTQTNTCP
jgi:Flp pilus assembly pilin Flp